MARSPHQVFRCTRCDAQFPKWEGRCRECGAWGSLKAEVRAATAPAAAAATVVDFASLGPDAAATRQRTGLAEFDRVLGGGLVPGSLTLIGGDPGVGKSTLLLQVAAAATRVDSSATGALYVSGEESAAQVKSRLDRLGIPPDNLRYLGSSDVETIAATAAHLRPALVVVDSLNTVRPAGESAGQTTTVRHATERLLRLAKDTATPVLLIGHVTKQGAVAGPKTVEHLVDAVLYLDDAGGPYRTLRAVKNRFGSVQEIGVWQMTSSGLTEVPNPAAVFLSDRPRDVPGAAVTALRAGSRVFLVEVQALVARTRFGYPQRRVSGFDRNRLELLVAVLTNRLRLPLPYHDVHLNVVGGLTAGEPAADLAVALATASALKNVALPSDLLVVGEVGLQGEVRSVTDLGRRLEEAARLGFKRALLPRQDIVGSVPLTLQPVRNLSEAFAVAFPS